jgi:hypothetical protein
MEMAKILKFILKFHKSHQRLKKMYFYEFYSNLNNSISKIFIPNNDTEKLSNLYYQYKPKIFALDTNLKLFF